MAVHHGYNTFHPYLNSLGYTVPLPPQVHPEPVESTALEPWHHCRTMMHGEPEARSTGPRSGHSIRPSKRRRTLRFIKGIDGGRQHGAHQILGCVFALIAALAAHRLKSTGPAGEDLAAILYVDGHVRAYEGTKKIGKIYSIRLKFPVPATEETWAADAHGAPVFVVMDEHGFDVLTWRKGTTPDIDEKLFHEMTHTDEHRQTRTWSVADTLVDLALPATKKTGKPTRCASSAGPWPRQGERQDQGDGARDPPDPHPHHQPGALGRGGRVADGRAVAGKPVPPILHALGVGLP